MTSEEIVTAHDALHIAQSVAKRYKRRCWWADKEDLEQEAVRAILTCRHRIDGQVGVPPSVYAFRVAHGAVQDLLWRQSSPVSGGLHDPRANMAGLHRAPIPGDSDDEDSPRLAALKRRVDEVMSVDRRGGPLREAELEKLRLDVRERIRAMAEQVRDGDLALAVMLGGKEPAEVRRATGRSPYKAVEAVRRKMRGDYPTWRLWRQSIGAEP